MIFLTKFVSLYYGVFCTFEASTAIIIKCHHRSLLSLSLTWAPKKNRFICYCLRTICLRCCCGGASSSLPSLNAFPLQKLFDGWRECRQEIIIEVRRGGVCSPWWNIIGKFSMKQLRTTAGRQCPGAALDSLPLVKFQYALPQLLPPRDRETQQLC